jgi:hypothetical protein
LTFHSRYAVPNSVNLLYLTAVNGVPTVVTLFFAGADAQGEWTLATNVPAGLSGLNLSFAQFGFTQTTGLLTTTHSPTVAFL